MGIAVTMKQHGGVFVLFGATYVATSALWYRSRLKALARDVALFGIGTAVPMCLVLLFVWRSGALRQFWFWTVTYAQKYASHAPGHVLSTFSVHFIRAVGNTELVWILASIGLVLCLCVKATRQEGVFLLQLTIFSLLAASVGFYFRSHYFIMLLPAVALCAGGFVFVSGFLVKQFSKVRTLHYVPLLLVLLALALAVDGQASFYLWNTPEALSRKMYSGNPFVEAVDLAQFIRKHSTVGDRIAILGSEPEILFYSRRRSATGFVYMYPLMETHKWALAMQMQMIREIEDAKPQFLVLVKMPASWLRTKTSELRILHWADDAEKSGDFRQVGLIDFLSATDSVSYWGKESRGKRPRGHWWIKVLERKERASGL